MLGLPIYTLEHRSSKSRYFVQGVKFMLVWFQTVAFSCCATQRKLLRCLAGHSRMDLRTGTSSGNLHTGQREGLMQGGGRSGKHALSLPHLLSSGAWLCAHHEYCWVWDVAWFMRNRFSAIKPKSKEESSLLKPFMSQPIFSSLFIAHAAPLLQLLLFLFPLSFSFRDHVCMGERNTRVYTQIWIGQMWLCGICSTWKTNANGRNNS